MIFDNSDQKVYTIITPIPHDMESKNEQISNIRLN